MGKQDDLQEAFIAVDIALDTLTRRLKGWKPQFGNQRDIDISHSMSRLNELKEELRKKRAAARGGKKLAEDLKRFADNLVWAIETNNVIPKPEITVPTDDGGKVRGQTD